MREENQKFGTLIQVYKNLEIGQCILFLNSKDRAVKLTNKLKELKFPITCLSVQLCKFVIGNIYEPAVCLVYYEQT